jgi:hypothetical protein
VSVGRFDVGWVGGIDLVTRPDVDVVSSDRIAQQPQYIVTKRKLLLRFNIHLPPACGSCFLYDSLSLYLTLFLSPTPVCCDCCYYSRASLILEMPNFSKLSLLSPLLLTSFLSRPFRIELIGKKLTERGESESTIKCSTRRYTSTYLCQP